MSSHAAAPTHYAYDLLDADRLCQGDVLERTPELVKLLKNYHAYYADQPKYKYFLVLTQSCDLVRRDADSPKARYITIAAVRPVEEAFRREALADQEWWQIANNVINEKTFEALALFASSLLDNNQPSYFYLHKDISVGLSGNYCAFLNLSVPLKVKHYDLCLNAKRVQLCEPFQAKLGWLVGNLYSRVGTKEWDSVYGSNACSKLASQLLTDTFRLVSSKKIAQATQRLIDVKPLNQYSPDEILKRVEKEKVLEPVTKLAKYVTTVISDFALPMKLGSIVVAQMSIETKLRHLIKKALESEHETPDDAAVALEQDIQEMINHICGDANLKSWTKLGERLTQKIVQNETIKQLLA